MAEGNEEDERRFSFSNYSRKREHVESVVEDDEEEKSSKPDLGLGEQHKFEKRTVAENVRDSDHISSPTGSNDVPKRDENPFSFKHFLKRDSGSSYHCTGARPKVYRTQTSENFDNRDNGVDNSSTDTAAAPYSRNTTTRNVSNAELSSVLPDFVQDHLIVEQCYLGHSDVSTPHLSVELEDLPDFAIENATRRESAVSNSCGRHSRQWNEPKIDGSDLHTDIPCDLTGTGEPHGCRLGSVPLDLPSFNRSPVNSDVVPGGGDVLPFDLPLAAEAGNDLPILVESSGTRSGSQLSEVGASKSLPDFLSDGPIHSGRHSDGTESSDTLSADFSRNSVSMPQSPEGQLQRLQGENERIRRELESARRQLLEQTRRMQAMDKELHRLQSKELDGAATLEKAIEQVEDDLKRSTRRAVIAENMVSRLKQENKALQDEIGQLRQENRELRYGGGATASGVSSSGFLSTEEQAQRLAQELRSAAGTAEASLRQLLNGVNNLRMIASTVENMHRIHDRTGDFLDIDDEPGPAL